MMMMSMCIQRDSCKHGIEMVMSADGKACCMSSVFWWPFSMKRQEKESKEKNR